MLGTILAAVTATTTATASPEKETSETTGILDAMTFESTEEIVNETTTFLTKLWETLQKAFPTILFALFVLFIGILLTRLIERILSRALRRSNVDDAAVGFLRSVVRVALYTLVVVITLSIVNVPMSSIVTVIGAAGLAVGLALQDSLSNLAGGFIILFSKPFKSGDFIETATASGKVESVSILYTKIATLDNKTVYIPNGMVAGAQITNYSDKELRRLDLEFSISYESDFELAKSILCKLIAGNPMALTEPEPLVRMGRHADSAIVLFVRVWTKNDDYWELNYTLLEQAKTAFDKNKIVIPYPQLDVHNV